MNRGPAITSTVVALALVNIGAATVIVAAMGQSGFAPGWVGGVLIAAGFAMAAWAITLWRGYLRRLRER